MATAAINKNSIMAELDRMQTEIKELKESDDSGDAGKDKRHAKWRDLLKLNSDQQNRLAELKIREERRT